SEILRCIFLLSLVAVAAAQKQSSLAAPRLTALKVTGTTRYTDKEMLAASGLQIGQLAADGDFKEAVQRLGNSGLFTGVIYSYTSSAAGMKLELQLSDIDDSKLVPRRRTRQGIAEACATLQTIAADHGQPTRPCLRGIAVDSQRQTISRARRLPARR